MSNFKQPGSSRVQEQHGSTIQRRMQNWRNDMVTHNLSDVQYIIVPMGINNQSAIYKKLISIGRTQPIQFPPPNTVSIDEDNKIIYWLLPKDIDREVVINLTQQTILYSNRNGIKPTIPLNDNFFIKHIGLINRQLTNYNTNFNCVNIDLTTKVLYKEQSNNTKIRADKKTNKVNNVTTQTIVQEQPAAAVPKSTSKPIKEQTTTEVKINGLSIKQIRECVKLVKDIDNITKRVSSPTAIYDLVKIKYQAISSITKQQYHQHDIKTDADVSTRRNMNVKLDEYNHPLRESVKLSKELTKLTPCPKTKIIATTSDYHIGTNPTAPIVQLLDTCTPCPAEEPSTSNNPFQQPCTKGKAKKKQPDGPPLPKHLQLLPDETPFMIEFIDEYIKVFGVNDDWEHFAKVLAETKMRLSNYTASDFYDPSRQ